MADLIDRQDVIYAVDAVWAKWDVNTIDRFRDELLEWITAMPSAQPTLYGYSIEHLALIARVMQKENVTPEKALEYFKDIQRMEQMIIDEQQETIKRAMEKWTI